MQPYMLDKQHAHVMLCSCHVLPASRTRSRRYYITQMPCVDTDTLTHFDVRDDITCQHPYHNVALQAIVSLTAVSTVSVHVNFGLVDFLNTCSPRQLPAWQCQAIASLTAAPAVSVHVNFGLRRFSEQTLALPAASSVCALPSGGPCVCCVDCISCLLTVIPTACVCSAQKMDQVQNLHVPTQWILR